MADAEAERHFGLPASARLGYAAAYQGTLYQTGSRE
jgi:hypothetical protein